MGFGLPASGVLLSAANVTSESQVNAIRTIVAASVVVWLVASRPALAHHSFSAEFDADKPVSVTGTVVELRWSNVSTLVQNQSGVTYNFLRISAT